MGSIITSESYALVYSFVLPVLKGMRASSVLMYTRTRLHNLDSLLSLRFLLQTQLFEPVSRLYFILFIFKLNLLSYLPSCIPQRGSFIIHMYSF